jgi:hypothetical protein
VLRPSFAELTWSLPLSSIGSTVSRRAYGRAVWNRELLQNGNPIQRVSELDKIPRETDRQRERERRVTAGFADNHGSAQYDQSMLFVANSVLRRVGKQVSSYIKRYGENIWKMSTYQPKVHRYLLTYHTYYPGSFTNVVSAYPINR